MYLGAGWKGGVVGLLDNFEKRLDDLVSGTFARAFKDVVEPVEIASRIQREMDIRAAIISRGRTVVPNHFTVELSAHDHERLKDFEAPIREELASLAKSHATEQRYTFLGVVSVELAEDPTLDTGLIRVRSEAKPDVHPRSDAPPAAPDVDAMGHPRLVLGSQEYPLTKSRTRIGRGAGVDISIEDSGVSRSHAEILLGMPPVIRDLGSTNGTTLDGRAIAEAPLHDGAAITMGSTTFTFRAG